MKSLKLLKRHRVIELYHYFLTKDGAINFADFAVSTYPLDAEEEITSYHERTWIDDFRKQEFMILGKLEQNLKNGWSLSKIPAFEKALLATALYEIKQLPVGDKQDAFNIIDQAVHFSKKYFDFENYKYVNKILDIIVKEQFDTNA